MKHLKSWLVYLMLILPLLFAGCNSGANRYAVRDSAIKAYISMVDTSGQYDTSELSHKVLKAYIANDTSFFKQLQANIKQQTTDRANWDLWNADIPLPKVQDLGADEAYRFVLSLMGTSAYEVATIYKTGDKITLHYVRFTGKNMNTVLEDSGGYTKQLQKGDWDELTVALRQGDFWQLKKGYGWRGTDGSDLTIIGYEKGDTAHGILPRYNFVHRFMSSTLNSAFLLVYDKLIDQKYKWF